MHQHKSSLKFLKSSSLVVVFLFIFACTFTGIFFLDQHFRIEDILLKQSGNEKKQIAGLEEYKDANLYFLKTTEVEKDILRLNPTLDKVIVTKLWPNKLQINVRHEIPGAILTVQDGYLLLSDQGTVLDKLREDPPSSYPKIKYYQTIPYKQYQSGEKLLFSDILDSLYFLQVLYSLKYKVNSIDIVGFHMLGLYTSDKVFYFSSDKDRKKQVYLLETAVAQFRRDGQSFKTLDVRYDNPVVTF